jgi:hypothetical protein
VIVLCEDVLTVGALEPYIKLNIRTKAEAGASLDIPVRESSDRLLRWTM